MTKPHPSPRPSLQTCIEAVEVAFREFQAAVEGPEMQDYASDAEARRALHDAAHTLKFACHILLMTLPYSMK